jgi:hypothetical protein
MSKYLIEKIISGGQTGVDRAALDVAIKYNTAHGGWCPPGRKAEDGVIPIKYNLIEAPLYDFLDPDAIFKKRTELNVKNSDGTLIILRNEPARGTLYTITMTEKYYKPLMIYNLLINNLDEIPEWLMNNKILKLNVAGPRESEENGIYEATYLLLQQYLKSN